MQKTYKEELTLRMAECDVTGQWRPGALLTTLQEVGGTHAALLGLGRQALITRNHAWIITRTEVQLDRCPNMRERISVETFPTQTRRWFFPRYYILRDDRGEQIGCAGTLWAVLDLKTRKMVAPDEYALLLPDNRDLPAPLGLPPTVNEVGAAGETAERYPVYTDLDANNHVNNTRYVDWCCDALGIDTMRTHYLRRLTVNYNLEVRPGEHITTRLGRCGDDFSYSGFADGSRCFDIGGTLAERTGLLEE